ncbi:MAG: hypothetical protein U9O98_03585 [Asgard group archaeon]|nr:hypothetical protein [Asgard group archaeon]
MLIIASPLVLLVSCSFIDSNNKVLIEETIEKDSIREYQPYLISNIQVKPTKKQSSHNTPSHNLKDIDRSVIVRGQSFLVTGRLTDNLTGSGIPDIEVLVFWEHFTWGEFETDREALEDAYLVGSGLTNSEGYFSITAVDSSHSKSIGNVTVYTVVPANPIKGITEGTYTTNFIECYATINMIIQVNSTLVRVKEYFYAVAVLRMDNDTIVTLADGEEMVYTWLGSNRSSIISSGFTNETFYVPDGTIIGYYALAASFNVSTIGYSYIVGDISSGSQVGSNAAKWANNSLIIEVYDGASIIFSIDDPVPPGPGDNPKIQREETNLTVSGTITDEDDNPFYTTINLDIYVHNENITSSTYIQQSIISDADGNFTTTFALAGSYLQVGENIVWIDVGSGESIIAQSNSVKITILGNSNISSIQANGTSLTTSLMVMPGEILAISGRLEDIYNGNPLANVLVRARWEDFGPLLSTNTTTSGNFYFNLTLPITINTSTQNGTVYLEAESTIFHTASNDSFSIQVFHSLSFETYLNNTQISEDATVTTLQGNTIYTNSTFTLSCIIRDQFNRYINNRDMKLFFGNSNTTKIISNGNISHIITGTEGIIAGTYDVSLYFDEENNFNFSIRFQDYPEPTPTAPPDTTTPTNGGTQMFGKIMIYITIGIVSALLIGAVVFAFGRFLKGKRQKDAKKATQKIDLETLIEKMDEAENAKDYRQAILVSYQAFEFLCATRLGIKNVQTHSPRELARKVAKIQYIPVRDVTMLIMKYEEAKYSDHKIQQANYKLARQAFHNIKLAIEEQSK